MQLPSLTDCSNKFNTREINDHKYGSEVFTCHGNGLKPDNPTET